MTGCKSLAYQCANDSECGTGRCEATLFCSFADSSCASGFRYGEHAGNSLGNECVNAMIDAPPMPDARPDAPPNAVTKSFGETGTTDYSNVMFDNEITIGDPVPYNGDHSSVDGGTGELSLVRFNLAAIPTTANVVSGRIEVETTGDGNIYIAGTVQVYRILESWAEPQVTYLTRDGVNSWTNSGLGPPNSRDTTVLATFTPTAEGRYMLELPRPIVQAWVQQPSSNFGVVMESTNNNGHLHLATKEGIATKSATMIVTYVP